MNDQFAQIRDLFLEALDREGLEAQLKFAAERCAEDPDLRAKLENMLRAHHDPGGLLESQATANYESDPGAAPTVEEPGTSIGSYKLLELIAEGGMGVVYVAEQTKPVRRKVALKIIKPGMDTKQVIARFEAERQALALMDHPHVAKVIDAGSTDTGRPYFVMELIRGIPITEYCDQAQMTTRERLELFASVCSAVQHAHLKGIIHRDIKPSNVLVTELDGKPIPKVIDFGVAKATNQQLTEHTIYTQFSQLVGTPLYMSPEQAGLSSVDVDTRSDVYSLGVLLYELLTGTTPFDKDALKKAGYDEMRRIIREEEPPRPSTRFSTLEAAESSTISERRGVDPRRLNQIVQGELDWIVMKALEKDRNRRYESATDFAQDVHRYLDDEAVEACPPSKRYRLRKLVSRNKAALITTALVLVSLLAGVGVSVWQALEADTARQLAERNLEESESQRERAESNMTLAMEALDAVYLDAIGKNRTLFHGDPIEARSKLTDEEKKLLKTGLDYYTRIANQNKSDTDAAFIAAKAFLQIGNLRAKLNQKEDAATAFSEAISRLNRLTRTSPGNAEYFKYLSSAYYAKSNLNRSSPQYSHALAEAERAVSRAIELDPQDATAVLQRADIRTKQRGFSGALQDFEKLLELKPNNASLFHQVSQRFLHCPDQTLRDLGRSLEYAKKAVELAPDVALYQTALGRIYWDALKDRELALGALDRAIELDPNYAGAYAQRQFVYRSFDLPQALKEINKALQLAPSSGYATRHRGDIYRLLGRLDDALADYHRAVKLSPNDRLVYRGRAVIYKTLHQFEAALSDYNTSLKFTPNNSITYKWRGEVHFYLGNYSDSLADIAKALELNLKDRSSLYQIPPKLVASCPDKSFRDGMLGLADKTIESADNAYGRMARARLRAAFGDHEGAIADFNKSVELEPKDESWWRCRADYFADQAKWQHAADDYSKSVELKPSSHYNRYRHALATLGAGDRSAYRTACQQVLTQFEKDATLIELHFAAWSCALGPDAVDDYTLVLRLARQAVEASPKDQQYLSGLGAVQFRARQYDKAMQSFNAAADSGDSEKTSNAYTAYFKAMTEYRLERPEVARESLAQANKLADAELNNTDDPPSWNRKLTLELLRKEADSLIMPADESTSVDTEQPALAEPSPN